MNFLKRGEKRDECTLMIMSSSKDFKCFNNMIVFHFHDFYFVLVLKVTLVLEH